MHIYFGIIIINFDDRLLRPGVVWFGEALDKDTLASANKAMYYYIRL